MRARVRQPAVRMVGAKLPEPVRRQLWDEAHRERRTISAQIRVILEKHFSERGGDDDAAA